MPFDINARLVKLHASAQKLVELAGVDLGQTREVYDWENSIPKPSHPKKTKTEYPAMYIYRTSADLCDVPDTGKATVDYKITQRTERTDDDGKKFHDYTVEIRSLDPMKGKSAEAKDQPVKGKTAKGAPAMGKARTVLTLAAKPSENVREILFARGGQTIKAMTKSMYPAKAIADVSEHLTTGALSRGGANQGILAKSLRRARNSGMTTPLAVPAAPKQAFQPKAFSPLAAQVGAVGAGITVGAVGASIVANRQQRKERNARLAAKQFSATDGIREILFGAPTRNDAGQFSPTDSGVISPEQATAAYGHPKDRAAIAAGKKRASGQELLQRAVSAATNSKAGKALDEDE